MKNSVNGKLPNYVTNRGISINIELLTHDNYVAGRNMVLINDISTNINSTYKGSGCAMKDGALYE